MSLLKSPALCTLATGGQREQRHSGWPAPSAGPHSSPGAQPGRNSVPASAWTPPVLYPVETASQDSELCAERWAPASRRPSLSEITHTQMMFTAEQSRRPGLVAAAGTRAGKCQRGCFRWHLQGSQLHTGTAQFRGSGLPNRSTQLLFLTQRSDLLCLPQTTREWRYFHFTGRMAAAPTSGRVSHSAQHTWAQGGRRGPREGTLFFSFS